MRKQEIAASLRGAVVRWPGFRLGPVDLEIRSGTVLVLIGPNGAGKTNLMNLLGGINRAAGGSVTVLGRNAGGPDVTWKAATGYVREQHPFYERWSGTRNLAFLAGFYPTWSEDRALGLAAQLDLPLEKPVSSLSKGNRMKLALVAALAHAPELLLLDEPTAGLDPLVRRELLDTLAELATSGDTTIVYSTHILTDVAAVADELVFIRDGRVVSQSDRFELESAWRRVSFRLAGSLPAVVAADLTEFRSHGNRHVAITRDHAATVDRLGALGATEVEVQRLSIDDIALNVLRRHGPGIPGEAPADRSRHAARR